MSLDQKQAYRFEMQDFAAWTRKPYKGFPRQVFSSDMYHTSIVHAWWLFQHGLTLLWSEAARPYALFSLTSTTHVIPSAPTHLPTHYKESL